MVNWLTSKVFFTNHSTQTMLINSVILNMLVCIFPLVHMKAESLSPMWERTQTQGLFWKSSDSLGMLETVGKYKPVDEMGSQGIKIEIRKEKFRVFRPYLCYISWSPKMKKKKNGRITTVLSQPPNHSTAPILVLPWPGGKSRLLDTLRKAN